MKTENKSITVREIILRGLLFCVMVFLFLVAVKLFGDAAKDLTQIYEQSWQSLLDNLSNPFLGLSLGIFLTTIMQSSSATTSIAVAMVATGTLTVEQAVPFVMGANIGTSITSTIVSMGHIGERKTFSRAYGAGALQDMFNVMTTTVLFPLEYCFHFLSRLATYLSEVIPLTGGSEGGSWNPLPWLVEQPVWFIHEIVLNRWLNLIPTAVAIIMLLLGLVVLFFALVQITKNMKVLMAARIEEMLNRVLSKNGLLGLAIGVLVTMIIQSSSITTSLLVPLVASGVLKLDTIYPILLGANIGTTVTALMAAMAYGGTTGLALALVHFLFNGFGVLIFYPISWMRLPLRSAKYLSSLAFISRKYAIGWTMLVFIILPILGLWIFSD